MLSAEDLLDAANSASATARNAWLAFLLFLTYLVVTLAGITDEALLLNKGIEMPVIDVNVAIRAFFVFGPILLLVLPSRHSHPACYAGAETRGVQCGSRRPGL